MSMEFDDLEFEVTRIQHDEALAYGCHMRSILSLCRWSPDQFSFTGWRDRHFRTTIGEYLQQSYCYFTLESFFKEFHIVKVSPPTWHGGIPNPRRAVLTRYLNKRIRRNRDEVIRRRDIKRAERWRAAIERRRS